MIILVQIKSFGLYSIPVKILKNHANSFKQPLTYLINFYFQQDIFNDTLKAAGVTKKVIHNYCLITLPFPYRQFLVNYLKNVGIRVWTPF